MDALRAEFEALVRPAGLPPPGEPLPREEVAIDQARRWCRECKSHALSSAVLVRCCAVWKLAGHHRRLSDGTCRAAMGSSDLRSVNRRVQPQVAAEDEEPISKSVTEADLVQAQAAAAAGSPGADSDAGDNSDRSTPQASPRGTIDPTGLNKPRA